MSAAALSEARPSDCARFGGPRTFLSYRGPGHRGGLAEAMGAAARSVDRSAPGTARRLSASPTSQAAPGEESHGNFATSLVRLLAGCPAGGRRGARQRLGPARIDGGPPDERPRHDVRGAAAAHHDPALRAESGAKLRLPAPVPGPRD